MSDLKSETIHGVKWSAISHYSNTIINFLLGIILARLLSPSDYGVVGMTAIFFAIAGIFIDGGLGAALIKKKDITKEDCSTIFFFNIGTSTFFYILLFLASPHIAHLLNTPILKDIIRVSSMTMVIGSLGSIHYTLMTKKVDFKTPGIINVSMNIITGITGVYMAYNGFGVWALVWPNVITSVIRVTIIWIVSSWRPSLCFSFKSFKEMFSFSGNLVLNSIFDKLYNEGTSTLIGRFYTPQMLGYYSKGMSTAQLPSISLYNIVGGVTFPILSKIQDNNETLVHIYSKYIRILSMISFFIMILLAALARPYVLLLYSEKWEPAVIFLQLFCLRYLLYHIHAINWNLLLVKGRSDIALKKEIINKTIKFSLLAVSIPIGVTAICIAQLIGSISDLFVNTYFAGKIAGIGFKKQTSDFLPYLILSLIACTPAFIMTFLYINNLITIIIGMLSSFTLYWGYLWLKRDDNMMELLNLLPFRRKI